MKNLRGRAACWWALACMAAWVLPAWAQEGNGKVDPDGLTPEAIRAAMPEYFHTAGDGRVVPNDIPDVFGPGAVLTVGNVYMKVTNWGHVGNLFTNVSSDPGGQWPGASGIEYLSSIRLAVGAVNPTATDPTAVRRVSYLLEWRPATLDPVDKIYRAYDGIINGARFQNDDGDGPDRLGYFGPTYIDEDFLDGHDNDGDGKIDEDFGAFGQQMYSCVMRDDTPQAINATFNEKHVPLGLECQQLAWAYSIPGFTDFNVVQYTIINRSNHELDSLYIGWLVDMDSGPLALSNYYADDLDIPFYPHGAFKIPLDALDKRRQVPHQVITGVADDAPLCTTLDIRVNGFSIGDDDGDDNRTTGIPSFLLIHYTTDPLGLTGPKTVGFRAFRSFTGGTPYVQGGNPIIDQQRYEFLSSHDNIDPETGWISSDIGDQKGDYAQWCSTGPWLHVPPGGQVEATIAFAVAKGLQADCAKYRVDYQRYEAGQLTREQLMAKYASLDNAIAAQIAYEGIWEQNQYFPSTTCNGCETEITAPQGSLPFQVVEDCSVQRGTEPRTVIVDSNRYYWFDFDCDYCTGVFDIKDGLGGLFHKTWNAAAPPPNPNTNLQVKYNYTDNPDRIVPAAGDKQITIAWDNLSEVTADPKSQWFDCRGYRLWKVSNWTRPVGSPGPAEDDWALIGEFRLFDYRDANHNPILTNQYYDSTTSSNQCPKIYIPNYLDPTTGVRGPATIPLCLERGDIWDRQTGLIIKPQDVPCVMSNGVDCDVKKGLMLGTPIPEERTLYSIGRYRYVDKDVKDGFLYFYSVTALDSTGSGATLAELSGRRSAVEAEGISPQAATRAGKHVWVVPNPYRGYTHLADRPSSWDLTPNASDPTGTHIDFMGMPPGNWTIRIYTVSGDLVATLKSSDAVNESLRPTVTDDHGGTHPGYNRQQDTANDGEARWNLISRNGQDVVSGIYIFTVDSSQGIQRGKFVVIR